MGSSKLRSRARSQSGRGCLLTMALLLGASLPNVRKCPQEMVGTYGGKRMCTSQLRRGRL